MRNFKSVSTLFSVVIMTLFTLNAYSAVEICDAQGLNCYEYSKCAIDGDLDGVPSIHATHHWLRMEQCPQGVGTFLFLAQTYDVTLGPTPTAVAHLMPVVSGFFVSATNEFMDRVYGARDVNGDGAINDTGVLVNNVLTYDSLDCDDTNGAISPRKTEVGMNGIDDDCNGLIDEHKFLNGEPAPAAYSTGLQKAAIDFKIKINDSRQSSYLSKPVANPKFKYELTAFSYNNVAAVQTATFTQNTAGSYANSVLTITSPKIFNKGEVYNIRIALKDGAGNPLGGTSIIRADQDGNQSHLIVGGSGLAGTSYFFRTLFLTKLFNERLAFQRGEVGRAGGSYPSGSKYNTDVNDIKWCDQLPKWAGEQTSIAMNGASSPFWTEIQEGFFEDPFQDPLFDGECIKLPNAPAGCIGEDTVNGTCDCNNSNLSYGFIDSASLDAVDASFMDDGKGPSAQFYYSSTQPLMTRALPGDILHHTGVSHFGTLLGYDQNAVPPAVYSIDGNYPSNAISIHKEFIDTTILEYPLDPERRQYWAEIEQITEFTK